MNSAMIDYGIEIEGLKRKYCNKGRHPYVEAKLHIAKVDKSGDMLKLWKCQYCGDKVYSVDNPNSAMRSMA